MTQIWLLGLSIWYVWWDLIHEVNQGLLGGDPREEEVSQPAGGRGGREWPSSRCTRTPWERLQLFHGDAVLFTVCAWELFFLLFRSNSEGSCCSLGCWSVAGLLHFLDFLFPYRWDSGGHGGAATTRASFTGICLPTCYMEVSPSPISKLKQLEDLNHHWVRCYSWVLFSSELLQDKCSKTYSDKWCNSEEILWISASVLSWQM